MQKTQPKPNKEAPLPPLGELHPFEHRLILAIRYKYRFSDVVIKTRHGLPYRLVLTERFEDLGSDTYTAEPIDDKSA